MPWFYTFEDTQAGAAAWSCSKDTYNISRSSSLLSKKAVCSVRTAHGSQLLTVSLLHCSTPNYFTKKKSRMSVCSYRTLGYKHELALLFANRSYQPTNNISSLIAGHTSQENKTYTGKRLNTRQYNTKQQQQASPD